MRAGRPGTQPALERWLVGSIVATVVLAAGACIPPRPSPSPSPIASPTVPPSASTGIVVDPPLLDLLPGSIDGVAVTPDLDTAAEIASDPALALFVEGIAVATAFGPPATDDAGDYVVVTLARLRPGAFDAGFHRGWRDTFDDAVCGQAGGVDGHAEVEIAGHQTFIGTCLGGIRTYHVHLPDRDVLVSMQAVGERRFGEQIVAGLTE